MVHNLMVSTWMLIFISMGSVRYLVGSPPANEPSNCTNAIGTFIELYYKPLHQVGTNKTSVYPESNRVLIFPSTLRNPLLVFPSPSPVLKDHLPVGHHCFHHFLQLDLGSSPGPPSIHWSMGRTPIRDSCFGFGS